MAEKKTNHINNYIKLADIVSLGNIIAGFLSIINSIEGNFILSVQFLCLAFILDHLDGKIARKMNTTSEFGKEIDSLCDIVSFIIAPVIFTYCLGYNNPFHILIYIIYIASGTLRLARYNVTGTVEDGKYYEGIPVTGSIIIPLTYLILQYIKINTDLCIILYIIHAILMLSTVKIKKP